MARKLPAGLEQLEIFNPVGEAVSGVDLYLAFAMNRGFSNSSPPSLR